MENFIVSARKYRPQHFNTVVGQSHISNTLKNAIVTKQLAQAYLFCGPRGVGKTTCARIFAKTINCTNVSSQGEACDNCTSCLSFNSGASLNVYELDAASNNSVEDIRNLVDQVRYAPQLGDYKVYVIDEVHMLSTNAFNAFLKTLEEPPKHAKFILATTEKHKIIPTILSRCQVFNFNRIKTEDISNHLAFMANEEQVSFEIEALHIIAQKADGALRDACSIFDQMIAFSGSHLTYKQVVENLHVLDYDYYFKITDAFLINNLPDIMVTFDDVIKKGFDSHNFLIGLGEHLRNILVSKDPQTICLLEVSENLKNKYIEQSQKCNLNFLLKSLALISKTDVNYKSAKNQRLLIEMALMQLTFLTASSDAEKKKNDLEVNSPIENNPKPFQLPNNNSVNEPPIKSIKQPSIPFEKLKLKSSFSLSEIKLTSSDSLKIKTQENYNPETKLEDKEINLELIKAAIFKFAEKKQSEGFIQISVSLSNSIISLEANTIKLITNNESQKEQLILIKNSIVDFIRQDIQNNSVTILIETSLNETNIKAYKPNEVFKEMTEKNPSLIELKKRFDLEVDY